MNNALSLWSQKSHETKYEDEHDRITYLNILCVLSHIDRIKYWILKEQVSEINTYTHTHTYGPLYTQ